MVERETKTQNAQKCIDSLLRVLWKEFKSTAIWKLDHLIAIVQELWSN